MSTAGSNWYDDPALLTAEVKRGRTRPAAAPAIRGYDDLVEIARGGQGVVFRAVQRSTRRPVAIKVLLDGELASGVARRRFEREIDLVASLRHPNIVSVYDSGATDDGRLYLVMEFVEGVPLDQKWPEAGRAPLREVLTLVALIGDAVQYAHQRGVIHRDLKPSNIRVDSAGQPHILDFGLAKVSEGQQGAAFATINRATLSTSGQFMGSLPWASPEQAIGNPDAIDARTDVYALGVMLHQMLTGRFPYDVSGGLKTTLDNITGAAPSRADRIRPEVGDEVGTIIAKTLSKEPDRRYQSAGELARDLRRFLDGEPIEAKRDSAWYTVKKTLRRYRVLAAAAALVMLATFGGLAVSLLALKEARIQRDDARYQTGRARAEASRAKAVSKFVAQMLGAADPGKDGKDIRVVELLGPSSAMADQTLADQPQARAAVHGVLSTAYRNLQIYDQAEAQARMALDIAEQAPEGRGLELARARSGLAAVLTDKGDAKAGLEQARLALTGAREAEGPDSEAAIEAEMALGYALDQLQDFEESLKVKKEVAERAARVLGPDAQDTLGARGNLAHTLYQMGKLDEAIPLLEDVIAQARRVQGPDNIAALAPISTLVSAYNSRGDFLKSEPLIKDAWERLRRTYGPESNTTLVCENNYAIVLHNSGRSAEALPYAEEALAGFKKIHGPDHVAVLRVMTLVGSIHGKLGDQEKQLSWQKDALGIADRTLGRSHQTTVYIRNNYASTLGSLKRYTEAVTEFRACAEDADKAFGPEHSMPPSVRYNLAKNLQGAGEEAEAISILEVASERLLATLGASSDWTTGAVNDLAELLDKHGRPEEARRWREKIQGAPRGSR